MEDFVLKLVDECKEFMRLSEMNKRSSFLPQGSPAYIVSKRWLKKYKEYLCLKEVKSRKKPEVSDDHIEQNHPGPISNVEDLCNVGELFLTGTGEAPFEKSVVDTYIKDSMHERRDFKVYN